MTAQEVNRYIGLPWVYGARGPMEYDCWGLLKAVRDAHFGGGIPDTPLGDAARDLYSEKLRSRDWEIVDTPSHGDGVLLREGDEPHVGVYLDLDGGGVLHAQDGTGVVFTSIRDLRLIGYSYPKFYRIHA